MRCLLRMAPHVVPVESWSSRSDQAPGVHAGSARSSPCRGLQRIRHPRQRRHRDRTWIRGPAPKAGVRPAPARLATEDGRLGPERTREQIACPNTLLLTVSPPTSRAARTPRPPRGPGLIGLPARSSAVRLRRARSETVGAAALPLARCGRVAVVAFSGRVAGTETN